MGSDACPEPSLGEIVWSTLFPSAIASAILELDADTPPDPSAVRK